MLQSVVLAKVGYCVMENNNHVCCLSFSPRYTHRPTMSGPGLYDPTEVMNRAQLNLYTKEGFIKVGFYVLSFLVYLYK